MSLDSQSDGTESYVTEGGVTITRRRRPIEYAGAIDPVIDRLDTRRGAVFSSNYEYPGRYTRWDTAIVDPPVVITASGRQMRIEALNPRGEVLVSLIHQAIDGNADIAAMTREGGRIDLTVKEPDRAFTEEERSRMPTVFSVLRLIVQLFKSHENGDLGLYGAFGYDLAFQFDPVTQHLACLLYTSPSPRDQRGSRMPSSA